MNMFKNLNKLPVSLFLLFILQGQNQSGAPGGGDKSGGKDDKV